MVIDETSDCTDSKKKKNIPVPGIYVKLSIYELCVRELFIE